MDNGGASTSDADITRWCISRISSIASAIFDPPPSASSIDSLIANATSSALISQFASGHRLSTIFMFLSSDGSLRIEESLSQQMQPSAAIAVLTRASSMALNPAVAWHDQIIVVTMPYASAVDSLHVLLNRTTRPLLDAAAGASPSSKHMPKALSQLTDLCSTLRLCAGSKRAEPVDFDRALALHASLKDALASQSADSAFLLLSGGDKHIHEDTKSVLMEWTADMRRLDDLCKNPSCSKLSDVEQHWVGAQAAVSTTLATANSPTAPPARLLDACLKHMDRDSAFRMLCRIPKANFDEARKDLSTRVKAADGAIAALRDLKIEALVSSSSVTALRASLAPMLKMLVERGRESSSRSAQSAEFMLLLSYDVFEKVCSLLERTSHTSLLRLPREDDRFKATVGLFNYSNQARSTGCDRLFRDWSEHCQALINDSATMTRMLSQKDVCCLQLQQMEQHLKAIAGCYKEHHQLLDVLNKITNSADQSAVPSRAVTEACACAAALNASFEAVARLPLVNMENSQLVIEAIHQFSCDARAIEDRLADVMNQMLRPAADKKKLSDMFAVFSAFAPLMERPKIKAYVENYQHVLFAAVQDSVSMLLTRSRKLNSGSHAEAFAAARGFPPIATHVICAGQIIRRLDSYRSRMQQVMGKDWEKTAADLPKKIENFSRQASPDSEVAAWMQEAGEILKENCFLFAAPLFYTSQRAGKKTLAVNFNARAANCVCEGLMLHALGYAAHLQAHTVEIDGSSVVASISFLIAEIAPLLPIAESLTESLQRFSDACQLQEPFARNLLSDARASVFKIIDEGTVICWGIDARSIREEIKPFAGRLSSCVKNFIRLSDHAHSLCARFNSAILSISASSSSTPSSALNLSTVVSSLDEIVQEVELGGFANTQHWILEADAALEGALVCRLSALLRTWTALLSADNVDALLPSASSTDICSDFVPVILSALKDAPIHHLNMMLKNSTEVLVCNPPVSQSTMYLVSALNSIITSFSSLQRLMARTIKKSVAKKAATYSTLASLLPHQDLCAAYGAIMTTSSRAHDFVGQWQSLQALWNSNPSEAAALMSTDLEKWRSVLSDIRRDRAQKNSSDTVKCLGPFRFDFSAAQSKVVQRYDLWYRSLIDLYIEQLSESKAALLARMNAARSLFESLSTNRGTDVSLKLLVAINEHDNLLQVWEQDISSMASGEALVQSQDDGRTRLLISSVTLEHLRGALHALEQIFNRRKTAITAAKSVLQQYILDEERDLSRLYEQLLKDWDAGKPDSKNFDAVTALKVLVGFNERCDAVNTQASKVQVARRALCMDTAALDMQCLSEQLKNEMSEMQLVWDSLSGAYRSLADIDAIQLVAASVSSIRSQLDAVRTRAKALPSVVLRYVAYRGLTERIEFRLRTLNVISDLKSPAIQPRHWLSLGRSCNVIMPADGVTLGFLWGSQLLHNDAALKEVISTAQGEFALHEFLDAIQTHWTSLRFETFTVGRRALNIKGWDAIFVTLTEHVTNMASMKSSPYFKAFQEQASVWEDRLFRISQFLDVLVDTQRKWIYLEGIFGGSGDIQSQIPLEASRFKSSDAEFVSAMYKISRHASVFDAVQDTDIKRSIDRVLDSLTKIQKGLSEYLESKRSDFPRFYFVGDEDLLELLGNSNDIIRLQQYLRKMFSGIAFLKLTAESAVTAALSPEGEVMHFESDLAAPSGRSVSVWLHELKATMSLTLRSKEFSSSHSSILSMYRDDLQLSGAAERVAQWMDSSVCQALIASLQVAWTSTTASSIDPSSNATLQIVLNQISRFLSIISQISMQPLLDAISRKKCEHCILELVHQRDVLRELSSTSAPRTTNAFSWLKHARFYVEAGSELVVSIADGRFSYGWEYLGVIDRLVHTSLTERCYLTLSQAVLNKQGGAPFGPAGTGKTETVKSLAAMLGRPCIVFNCDASFDLASMGRIFSGLCQTGAWGCFDEFNRLEERVLSAVSQQIFAIQMALRSTSAAHVLEINGRYCKMDPSVAIFVTMNLGYAGRAVLPDNLKQLFRGVAMTKPNSAAIAEITLFTKGFVTAESLASKVVSVFESCRAELSKQKHYDFGLRALKSVLSSAGIIRRDFKASDADLTEGDEEQIVIEAFNGSILPKLLKDDAALLMQVLDRVFVPSSACSHSDAKFLEVVALSCKTLHLSPSPQWMQKLLQIKQLASIHHGIMLVGSSGTGKSSAFRCLLHALDTHTASVSHVYVIDPKTVKKEDLYGKLDPNTREWSDGLFTAILRRIAASTATSHRHWIVFDGDLDPDWVESLNSVLDDNKTLTLPNGERIELLPSVRVIFEVWDIGHGTPATVSRCGMVWFAENTVLVDDLLQRYMSRLLQLPLNCVTSEIWSVPVTTQQSISDLQLRICAVLEPLLARDGFLSAAVKLSMGFHHIMPVGAMQLCSNVIGLLARFLDDAIGTFSLVASELADAVQRLLCMACWWGLSASMFESDRHSFSTACAQLCLIPLPSAPLLDMFVSQIDFSWKPWSSRVPFTEIEACKITKDDSLIPTVDTLRHEHLIRCMVLSSRSVLLCGPPGSGKSMSISSALSSFPDITVVHLSFSSSTQPLLIMRALEHNCAVTRTPSGLVMRPHNAANRIVLFCDEVNLPAADTYGTQTAITLLRQILQFGGFWRPSDASWIRLEQVHVIAACNPAGDTGRIPLPDRFLRHVLVLHVDFPSRQSIEIIYGAFTRALMRLIPSMRSYASLLCDAMVELHFRVVGKCTRALHDHYVFSPRDLSRWIRGMYEIVEESDGGLSPEDLVRFWAHEALRLYGDRLVQEGERQWLDSQIDDVAASTFVSVDTRSVLLRPILFSRWTSRRLVSTSMHEMSRYIEQRLVQFQEEELDVKLVVFDDFVDNCLRLDRILRQTVGHALLIGTAGVGKTVISRFVSWMNGLSIFQIKAHAKYSEKDFQEDLRSVMRRCGCGGERISFIIDESNILSPSFLEMMNSLLASGSIPGLFVGEELSKLLQTCRESAIVKGGSSAADPELLAAFHDSVRRHLHVIFTMNPATSEFSGRSSSSPALFNRCVINWMGNWSPKSFQQVCNQYVKNVDTSICKAENVDDNDFKANVSLALVSNHQRACESAATSLSRIVHFSPRQFLDAISQFMRFFHEKRDELDARQLHLNSGLKRLVETESAVTGLQGQLREKNDDLLRQNADAETTLADMVSRQQEAEGRRVAVEQLAAEVKAKQAATELRKISVESRLKEVEPAVADAQTAVRSIKKAQLDELRVMASPPSAVKMSLEAICTLIYGAKSPSWDDIRKFIRRDDFISGILDFDVKELLKDPKRLKSMRPYFDDAAFNFETVNRSSKACGPLVKWMESQVMFAEVLEQVEPLRVELLRLNDDIGLLSRQKEAATSELQQLQATISSYKESYALLIASVQTTKAEIASVTDKLQRSTQLIQNLASERSRWQIQQESFAAEQRSLLGDAVVHACFCVYSGCFDQEQRSGLLMSWMSNVERLGIIVSSSIQPHKDIVTAQMRLQWAQHGLPSDALCLENACILERALRPPLVIDPSDIAGSYIKSSLNSKAAGSSITSTFNDAAFPRQLENCLRFGTALIVSDVVSVDPILLPLLNREFRKTGGRCLVRLGSSEVDCSPSFSLIMTTRSSSPIIGPDISSRITLVNFTVTLHVLESQLRSIILKHQKPEVDAQLQQLDSLKSECRAHLQELEDSLLSTLSECHGSLLDNDTVISALQNLKLQSSSITNRLADAESSYAAAAMTCAAITPLAHVTSCLFFELQKLRQLRSHYVLSLQSFTSNVRGVLLDQPKDLSTEAIQAQVLRVFTAVTSDVLLWVLQDDRIVACVIIARLFSSFTGHPLPDDELAFLLSPKPSDADQDSDLSVICGPSSAAAVQSLSNLPRFANLLQHIRNNPSIWAILRSYSLSPESLTSATVTTLPTEWMPLSLPHHAQLWLNVLVAYCFSHRLALSFVRQWLHAMFSNSMIDRETPDVLSLIPRDPHIPLLLLSSSGFDMTARVTAAASSSSASSSVPSSPSQSLGLRSFSMGSTDTSGSGSILDKAISAAAVSGGWVMISNVHLGATAVVNLQKKIAGLKLHPSFRLIFTAEISHADVIHQTTYDNSKVAVFEAPRSARDVLLGALACIEPSCSPQPIERSRVLLLVAWLHAVVVTRLQYVPDGWSKRYEFNETDLYNAARVACSWIDRSFIGGVIREHLPMDALDWNAIAFLVGETVYGGRVDDENDFSVLTSMVRDILRSDAFAKDFVLGRSRGSAHIVAPEECLGLGSGQGGAAIWARESIPVQHDVCWLGLAPDADVMIESRVLSEALRSLKAIIGSGSEQKV